MKQTCTTAGCKNEAVLYVHQVSGRMIASTHHLCDKHAELLLESLGKRVPHFSQQQTSRAPREFEIETMARWSKGELNPVYLKETDGEARFSVLIGILEFQALASALHKHTLARPTTHAAIVQLIRLLGGELQDVLVDRLEPGDPPIYHAKLNIVQQNKPLQCDVRPSDAFNIAVTCNVPIRAASEILRLERIDEVE